MTTQGSDALSDTRFSRMSENFTCFNGNSLSLEQLRGKMKECHQEPSFCPFSNSRSISDSSDSRSISTSCVILRKEMKQVIFWGKVI